MNFRCNHLKIYNVDVSAKCNLPDDLDCEIAYDRSCDPKCEYLEVNISYMVIRS